MIWRFADFEFDEQRWSLSAAGQPLELEPRPLEVLRQLLRYAGEVVRKDELVEAVYGHQHVSDGALNQAVSKLRSALGDREQNIIATVHRLGYRLAVPVQARPALDPRRQPGGLRAGDPVPGRDAWLLDRLLSRNRQIEVWLARHRKLDEPRVFKFSLDGVRLSALKREVTLYRTLREQLGERDDVVRLLDWNFDQAPYFIEAEYGGDSLLDWAGGGRLVALPQGARLELLARIADVLGAAHSVGVLHKDLKPANVLIYRAADGATDSWRPRLVDFGSGLLLDSVMAGELGITRLGFTQTQARHDGSSGGTPLYLAPEVISGNVATALADVYALGVMLYQLVVGDLHKPLAPGWEQDVADELLRQDIAAAVDGNPDRRLGSARELAQRLRQLPLRRVERQRLLAAESRAAEAARALDRARARRPWRIAALAAVLAGFVIGALLYRNALLASRAAGEQAQLAEAVTDFFNREVLSAASPYDAIGASPNPTVREAVDRAVARIGQRFASQPATEAAIRFTIGQIYGELTDLPAALEQDRRAVALFEQSLGAMHPRTLRARYWLAQDLTEASHFDEAKQQLDAADRAFSRIARRDADTELAARRAHCYHAIITSHYEAATAPCEATVALQQQVDPQDATALFKWRTNLATLYARMGRFDAADALFVQGLASLQAGGSGDSLTAARFRNLYGLNLLAQRRYADAEAMLQQAYAVMSASAPDNLYTFETLGALATIYSATGRGEQAIDAARRSLEGYRRSAGSGSHYTAQAQALLGETECAAGRCSDGLPQLRTAADDLARLLGPRHPQAQLARYRQIDWQLRSDAITDGMRQQIATLDAAALNTAQPAADWPQRLRQLAASLEAQRAGGG